MPDTDKIIHSETCKKARHISGFNGYLHGGDDDSVFCDADRPYCGRCHDPIDEHDQKG